MFWSVIASLSLILIPLLKMNMNATTGSVTSIWEAMGPRPAGDLMTRFFFVWSLWSVMNIPCVSFIHQVGKVFLPLGLTKIIMFFFWEQVCSTPLKFRMKPTPLNGITYSWCLGLVMLQIVQFKCILNQVDPCHPSYQGGRHRRGGKGERELDKV